jgi:hypothetical protein
VWLQAARPNTNRGAAARPQHVAPRKHPPMNQNPRAPLRLLLVTDRKTIPNWLFKCIQDLERSGAANLVLVVQAAQEKRPVSLRFVSMMRHFLFSLYGTIDHHLYRGDPDAFAPIDVQSALPNRRFVVGTDLLEEEDIDVVLDPFSLLPGGCLAERSRYGVWSTTLGRPAFWEVIEGRTTETRLCIRRKEADKTLAFYVAVASTDRRSVARSHNRVCWKISATLAKMIEMLWKHPDAFLKRLEAAQPFEAAQGLSRPPGNLEMLRAGTVLIRRSVSDMWIKTLYREQWTLAYQHGASTQRVMGSFRKLIPPMELSWADPFPIQVGNDHYIFHEQWPLSTGKGSIVVTVVDDQGQIAGPIPVLEKDYHLSYPLVFQWDGDLFMIPETASHNQVELYRCIDFPAHWKLERVVLSGLRALDPTPAFLSGRWWLFATMPAYGAGKSSDELHLFSAESPLGPWTPHRNNPVKTDVRAGRPAGRIFEHQGHFYRPAQDCSVRYGYAVSINRILQLDPETYEEVEVDKILPDWSPSLAGVHTLNRAGDMTVIDCLLRRRKFFP